MWWGGGGGGGGGKASGGGGDDDRFLFFCTRVKCGRILLLYKPKHHHASYPRLVANERREARTPPVLHRPRHGVPSTETSFHRRHRNQRICRQVHDRTHAVFICVPKHTHQQTEKSDDDDQSRRPKKPSHLALVHFTNRDSQTEIKREKEVNELELVGLSETSKRIRMFHIRSQSNRIEKFTTHC